jgi:hypothetical protein
MRATGLVAAGVVVGGILTGTVGAQAASPNLDEPNDGPPHVRIHRGAPGGPGALGGREGGAELAKALGISQAKLHRAVRAVRDDIRPASRPAGPPTASERKAMEDKFAAALADELGMSKAKVEAALEKVHKEHRAEHRAALSDRLDRAVKDGKLTSADKASVLKAFDAGVLGGPGPR